MQPARETEILATGRFLRLVRRGHWEYVERVNTTGAVVIVAVTADNRLLLVEQFRLPLGCPVIELPAGLAGDSPQSRGEDLCEAARRELLEETGYAARDMLYLTDGPSSAGLSTEEYTLLRAVGLARVGRGGGDESEAIVVYEVPLADVPAWLDAQRQAGKKVDPRIYAGLYFVGLTQSRNHGNIAGS